MGLFDKKFCDICGEKIGLLGNRKLDDGNLCKNCARKLSPFFSERRNSTVAQIKEQLAYRAENERQLSLLHPTVTYGRGQKVCVDQGAGKFIVTRMSDWKSANPDIIALSQVTDCRVDVEEHRTELYTKDAEGKRISYRPPRYEYAYEFRVTILVNSPWFSEIEFELSENNRPDSRYTDLYRDYEREADELRCALTGRTPTGVNGTASAAPFPAVGTASAGEMTRRFVTDPIPYRYSDRSSGISMDVSVTFTGSFSFRAKNPADVSRLEASSPDAISGMVTQALSMSVMNLQADGVKPEQLGTNPDLMNAFRTRLSNTWSLLGLELSSISFTSCKVNEQDQKALEHLNSYQAAHTQATGAAAAGKWKCPVCEGDGNEGKFCEYCGSPRPAGL